MSAEIKIGRFQWVARVQDGEEFINLDVNGSEVGYVSRSISGEGFDWMLTVGSEWACNEAPVATLSAAKDRLAGVVRGIIARTPGNNFREYYG